MRPRYIDADACTACGLCTQYCPKHHVDPYNEGLAITRPIHIDYAQAVPATYYIDPSSCLFLQHETCQICVPVCQSHAINFKQQPEERKLQIGAVILSPGFGKIDPKTLEKFSYGKHPDVVTAFEFERMTTASGPFLGEVKCFSDGRHPKRMAFIQCVGSRDIGCNNGYCSSVCCMYAIKEALVTKEHDPEVDITIFYIDIRTQGKDFDAARERAEAIGIKFVRAKVADVTPWENRLQLTYATLDGQHKFEPFDMVVLSVGLESPKDAQKIADITKIDLNKYDFCATNGFNPLQTSQEGIVVAGAFQGPKDIPESVTQSSAAASLTAASLKKVRGKGVELKIYPEEQVVAEGDEARIGVFVCHCGINISSVVDVASVANYAGDMKNVTYYTENLYSCSQDAQEVIKKKIKEHKLNRVVIAACSPRTHEPLFQETLRDAGLNRNLFEMVNIRDQCSWVHAGEPELATIKSKDLVRMAVSTFLAKTMQSEINEETSNDIAEQMRVVNNLERIGDAVEALERLGAELVMIDALTASALPALDGLYIGGGFPETSAGELAANAGFRQSIKQAAEAGLPIYAECGGLIYLGESIVLDGQEYPLAGVFPIRFGMSKKPQAHGYSVFEVDGVNPFYSQGAEIKGHEFRYSTILEWQGRPEHLSLKMTRGQGFMSGRDGLTMNNVLALYTHVHADGTPEWADGFMNRCRLQKESVGR